MLVINRLMFFFLFNRGCTRQRINSFITLSSWNIAERHDCHRLCDAIQIAVVAGSIQIGEIGPAHHIAQSEFHGPAAWAGTESSRRRPTTAATIQLGYQHRFRGRWRVHRPADIQQKIMYFIIDRLFADIVVGVIIQIGIDQLVNVAGRRARATAHISHQPPSAPTADGPMHGFDAVAAAWPAYNDQHDDRYNRWIDRNHKCCRIANNNGDDHNKLITLHEQIARHRCASHENPILSAASDQITVFLKCISNKMYLREFCISLVRILAFKRARAPSNGWNVFRFSGLEARQVCGATARRTNQSKISSVHAIRYALCHSKRIFYFVCWETNFIIFSCHIEYKNHS